MLVKREPKTWVITIIGRETGEAYPVFTASSRHQAEHLHAVIVSWLRRTEQHDKAYARLCGMPDEVDLQNVVDCVSGDDMPDL